jgi:hypothetical protein
MKQLSVAYILRIAERAMPMHTFPAPVVSAELVGEMAATATGFVASLNARQCGRALLTFASDDRRDWHYVPRQRHGLPLRDMDEAQRVAALALLRIGLSEAGGRKAIAIMDRENILKRSNPSENYDPLDYAFAVYGDPRMPPPWGWSVEGHHLSLHFTVCTSTEITVTPFFMGVAPLMLHGNGGSGDPLLLKERDLAAQIVRGLDAQEREQAIIADRSMGDILSGPGREESLRTPVGLPLTRLTDARRDAVLALVDEYFGRLRAELADVERARLREAGVGNLRFAWAGPLDPGQPHYYRIHGPSLLLEYDNTQEDANHIHTVWHDPGLSFGGDALRDHYNRSHLKV